MFFSPAYAQTAPAAGNAAAAGGMVGLIAFVPYLAIFAIFYFLIIRPQQTRAKAHRAMIDGVQKGDEVVTAGGVIGKVTRVMDAEVEVEIAPTVKIRVLKATLGDVRGRNAPAAANDTSAGARG
ncbi:preprotein translocase subunit YajC [alpha proteobacterium AAP81b]|nr:preprotein translocase subunit YajC [alpha proteobacterium AAP81b]